MTSALMTTGDVARFTGLSTQAINSRIKNGKFVEPIKVVSDKRGTQRFFDRNEVFNFFANDAKQEMIRFLEIIIKSPLTNSADLANAIEVRDGLIDGSTSITDVISDLK